MSRQSWNKSLLALLCCQLLPGAYLNATAADALSTKPVAQTDNSGKGQPVDEVTVSAERLIKLRLELQKAQDAFYAEYNRVNTVPEFQTRCDMTTDYSTRIEYHECTPKFVITANEYYTQMLLRGEDVAPPIFTINGKMPAYRKHVHDVADQDPKLAEQARNYLALSKRYETIYKTRLEGRRNVPDH